MKGAMKKMKSFDTYFPTKLIFGEGTIQRLGETARNYGEKAMVVTTGDDMKLLWYSGQGPQVPG